MAGGVVSIGEGGDEPRAAPPKPAWPLLPQAQLQTNRPPPRLFPPSRACVFLSRSHAYTYTPTRANLKLPSRLVETSNRTGTVSPA